LLVHPFFRDKNTLCFSVANCAKLNPASDADKFTLADGIVAMVAPSDLGLP
jgi:hypothetical protein